MKNGQGPKTRAAGRLPFALLVMLFPLMAGCENPWVKNLLPGPETGRPVIMTAVALPPNTAGIHHNVQLAVTGTMPIEWMLAEGTLPAGLTLSAHGLISGTPSAAGQYTFTVRAENAEGYHTRQFTLTVNLPVKKPNCGH